MPVCGLVPSSQIWVYAAAARDWLAPLALARGEARRGPQKALPGERQGRQQQMQPRHTQRGGREKGRPGAEALPSRLAVTTSARGKSTSVECAPALAFPPKQQATAGAYALL